MNPSKNSIACIISFFSLWNKNEISTRAAALTYTFILSLVPAIAVCLAIFSFFVDLHGVQNEFKVFLLKNLAAGTGGDVIGYLDQFIRKVRFKTIGYVGFAALVTTSVLLLSSIEHSMNKIWRTEKNRNLKQKIIIYTLFMFCSPISISLSIATTAFIKKYAPNFFFEANLLAFLFNTIFLSTIYKILPNTKVQWKYAIYSAALIAILSDAAKWGYAIYTARAIFYNKVYGSLAALPFFLIWIYLNWIIFLTGTQLNYFLQEKYKENNT